MNRTELLTNLKNAGYNQSHLVDMSDDDLEYLLDQGPVYMQFFEKVASGLITDRAQVLEKIDEQLKLMENPEDYFGPGSAEYAVSAISNMKNFRKLVEEADMGETLQGLWGYQIEITGSMWKLLRGRFDMYLDLDDDDCVSELSWGFMDQENVVEMVPSGVAGGKPDSTTVLCRINFMFDYRDLTDEDMVFFITR